MSKTATRLRAIADGGRMLGHETGRELLLVAALIFEADMSDGELWAQKIYQLIQQAEKIAEQP